MSPRWKFCMTVTRPWFWASRSRSLVIALWRRRSCRKRSGRPGRARLYTNSGARRSLVGFSRLHATLPWSLIAEWTSQTTADGINLLERILLLLPTAGGLVFGLFPLLLGGAFAAALGAPGN